LAIVGPNGAGKTSLLKALAGILPHQGRIVHQGRLLSELSAPERLTRIAYVPQRSALCAMLTVRGVVEQARYCQTRGLGRLDANDRRAVEEAMAALAIDGWAARPYPELSGGEQRRVLLARALASGARTLLLDEPTAFLDVKSALELLETLAGLGRQGHCVVSVLHDLDDVRRRASHTLLLDEGRQVAFGPTPQVLTAERVASVYRVHLVERERLGFRLSP
jgi:iron complex transport system ATP-binding protein